MDGVTTVSVSGQVSPVGPPLSIESVTITALATNTGLVYIGRAPDNYKLTTGANYKSVGPSASTKAGIPLGRNVSITVEVKNLADLWLDVATGGEGVAWSCKPPCCSSCTVEYRDL